MSRNKLKIKPQLVINMIAIIIILALAAFITIRYWDTFQSFGTADGLEKFIAEIQSTGIFGALILLLIQTLQVVVAFIPGEFVELAAGAMFGPWLGLLLCLIGLNIGTLLIFLFVKWFGKTFVSDNVSQRDFEKLKFLNDPRRSLVILFFIFIIPGIPKDILIYPIPLTKIKMSHFMIMSTVARIPTVISSTFVGAAVIEENYISAIVTFVISLILAALGLIFNKQICELIEKRFPQKANAASSPASESEEMAHACEPCTSESQSEE